MSINIPRPEYPRPDFERMEWFNLNGEWEFEFDDSNVGEFEKWYTSRKFSKKIIVPFCFQSKLGGIHDTGFHENLWYKREFELGQDFEGKRIILNFGAVDYAAKVWINEEYTGSHRGGHTPFKIDITRYVKKGINTIVIKAEDKYECTQPRGKQYWLAKPERCWYTPTSGIWQTVWIETVGDTAFDRIKLTPDIDKKHVEVELFLDRFKENLNADIEVSYKGVLVNKTRVLLKERISKVILCIKEEDYVDDIHYWAPETPNLYDIHFTLFDDGKQADFVKSYFGMRKISIKGDMILLNNRPYYQKLVLDQGYWPDSLLTPPSDEAIKTDIKMIKKFGFNGARKHQKIEDPRYYYWADKLGLLVWGEMPSGYSFNDEEIENITEEWVEFIKRDCSHPCIVTWVPLNESWGVRNIIADKKQQDFAKTLYYITKTLDGTRLISTNDGWEMVKADICGVHDYVADAKEFSSKFLDKVKLMEGDAWGRMLCSEGTMYEGQPIIITEYGGTAFEGGPDGSWGYDGAVKDQESFLKRYKSLTDAIRDIPYVRGYCYTQLTDVFQEVNGLMTAGRKPKADIDEIKKINL